MRNRNALWTLSFFLLAAGTAAAQDFGRRWIDEVTRELQEEAHPLTAKPALFKASGGLLYYYDDNIFLRADDEEEAHVAIAWARGRVEYAETHFDAVADYLSSYTWYFDEDHEDFRDHQQRFYGRARYQAPKWTSEGAVLVRRESDPIDSTFVDRAGRIVASFFPRVDYEITPTVRVELSGEGTWVFFDERPFDRFDNVTYRAAGAIVYKTPDDIDLLWQAGMIRIDYDDSALRDADGWFYRGGVRGEIVPRWHVEAYAGVSAIESDKFAGNERNEHTTGEFSIMLRNQATETTVFWADYSRRFGFAIGAVFQTIDRVTLRAEIEVNPRIRVGGRAQYDRVHDSNGEVRDFTSLSSDAVYILSKNFVVEGGVTYRFGDTAGGEQFGNFIGYAGLGVLY